MFQKLTEDKLEEILACGTKAFAASGYERVSMNQIAKSCGLSVGVLYKYYENKEAFFRACLERSLGELKNTLDAVMEGEAKPLERVERILRILIPFSKAHPDVINMYHRISCEARPGQERFLAEEIEGMAAGLYREYIAQGQLLGQLRTDIDPAHAAFFFDNLLMMLQFSFSSDYYKERMKLYLGDNCMENDEMLIRELMRFLASAFTFAESEIIHEKR